MTTKKKAPKATKKSNTLKVLKLDKTATLPTRTHSTDAGIDIYSNVKGRIAGNTVGTISTGIAIEVPKGYFAKIFDRSGFSINNTLSVKAGVIDSGYRGEIKIIMANTGPYPLEIDTGTKIAQIVILPVPEFEIKEVKTLSKTKRGEKGFGSSGSK